jgi:hypothetical protein
LDVPHSLSGHGAEEKIFLPPSGIETWSSIPYPVNLLTLVLWLFSRVVTGE